jgi:hypothetical protein
MFPLDHSDASGVCRKDTDEFPTMDNKLHVSEPGWTKCPHPLENLPLRTCGVSQRCAQAGYSSELPQEGGRGNTTQSDFSSDLPNERDVPAALFSVRMPCQTIHFELRAPGLQFVCRRLAGCTAPPARGWGIAATPWASTRRSSRSEIRGVASARASYLRLPHCQTATPQVLEDAHV